MKIIKRFPQMILGLALGYAGIGHLTTSRQEFQAQVPNLLKDYADFVVVASGVVEIALGLALVGLWRYRVQVGWIVAAFFVAIFPGKTATKNAATIHPTCTRYLHNPTSASPKTISTTPDATTTKSA